MNRVTLPLIDNLPTESQLAKIVEQAHHNREDLIALPFVGHGGGHFVLAVSFSSSRRNIPRWYLFAGDDDGAPIVWMRETSNREEILLILSGRAARSGVQTKEPPKPKIPVDTLLKPAGFDQTSYYQFYQRLIDPETGMFPSGAFYWFLSQELVRYQRTNAAFSLILLDPRIGQGPLDKPTFNWLGQVLTSQMRKLDYVCELNSHIAVLLAASELQEAVTCAERLSDIVSEKSKNRGPGGVALFAGVAAVPESCEHPGVLISAAQTALSNGLSRAVKITAFDPATMISNN